MTYFLKRSDCPVCGSSNQRILLAKPLLDPAIWNFIERYYQKRIPQTALENAVYEIAECSDCAMRWQTMILNDEGMRLLYDEWIAPQGSLSKKQTAPLTLYSRYAREVYQIAGLLNQPQHQLKVLDYGMGWGQWILMAKAFGYEAYGLEFSEHRRQFGQDNGIQMVNYDDLGTIQFDFINAEQVFEHIPNPLAVLQTLVQSLNPGGIVHIGVPDGDQGAGSLQRPNWQATHDAYHPLEHINIFNFRSLVRLAERAGLGLIPTPHQVIFEPIGWKAAARFILPRRRHTTDLYFRDAPHE